MGRLFFFLYMVSLLRSAWRCFLLLWAELGSDAALENKASEPFLLEIPQPGSISSCSNFWPSRNKAFPQINKKFPQGFLYESYQYVEEKGEGEEEEKKKEEKEEEEHLQKQLEIRTGAMAHKWWR
jgi:hypothetical protein